MKLLDCMDINLANSETSFHDIIRRYQGTEHIEYRQALPLIMYDNTQNAWFSRKKTYERPEFIAKLKAGNFYPKPERNGADDAVVIEDNPDPLQ